MAEIVLLKEDEGNLPEEEKMRQLPPDIIMEILVRTDIESLPRLRWVCKEWRRLLSHTYMINHHHQKTKNVRGFILLDDTFVDKYKACLSYDIFFFPHPSPPLSESSPSLTFLLEPVKIEASTPHGLLLCFGLVHERYYVCKPTTQEWSPIPSPNTQNYTITMAMSVASTSPLRFKIMRISRYPRTLKFQFEVFDSDSCGMWKTIEGIGTSLDGNRSSMFSANIGVVVNGSFYWIEHKGDYQVTKVLCADLWAEELKTLELPEEVVTEDVNARSINRLSNLNGGLGLVHSRRNVVFNFWAMTSNMVEQKWEKLKVLDMGDDLFGAVRFAWMREDYIVDNVVLMKPNRNRREIFW